MFQAKDTLTLEYFFTGRVKRNKWKMAVRLPAVVCEKTCYSGDYDKIMSILIALQYAKLDPVLVM